MLFSGVSRIARGSLWAISAPLYVQALPEVQRTGAVGAVVAFWHCDPAAAAVGSGASALVSTKLRAVTTMSGTRSPLRSPIRVASGTVGHWPTPTSLFSAAEPAHGGNACGEDMTRANCGATRCALLAGLSS